MKYLCLVYVEEKKLKALSQSALIEESLACDDAPTAPRPELWCRRETCR